MRINTSIVALIVGALLLLFGGGPVEPPGPGPEPKPTPGAEYQITLFQDRDNAESLTLEQTTLLSGRAFRERLEEAGHVFVGSYDVGATARSGWAQTRICHDDGSCSYRADPPEELSVWWPHVEGDPMPRVAIAPREGGQIDDYPLPPNEEAFWQGLEEGFE